MVFVLLLIASLAAIYGLLGLRLVDSQALRLINKQAVDFRYQLREISWVLLFGGLFAEPLPPLLRLTSHDPSIGGNALVVGYERPPVLRVVSDPLPVGILLERGAVIKYRTYRNSPETQVGLAFQRGPVEL